MDLLQSGSKDENMRSQIGQPASSMRIRLFLAKKLDCVCDYFDEFTAILRNLKDDRG